MLRFSPSEPGDEEDEEEAAAARRAQRFALDPRVRFLEGCLRQALRFPEETWGQYLESEDHRQALGDFLESSGPASLVFTVAAAGRLSASPEVRCNLRGLPAARLKQNLKSASWTQQKSGSLCAPALQFSVRDACRRDGCIKCCKKTSAASDACAYGARKAFLGQIYFCFGPRWNSRVISF